MLDTSSSILSRSGGQKPRRTGCYALLGKRQHKRPQALEARAGKAYVFQAKVLGF